jgi:predicted CopG family antitoxin
MGRTVPTYRLHLESILNDWTDYRRALREKDREPFDRLLNNARQHASAASYCAHLDPTVLAFLSILLEMQKDIETAKTMHMHMDTQDTMAKNIAVADDVYEMLTKAKQEDESFSDVIRRWRRSKGSLLDFYGMWADIPEKEWKEMEAAIFGVDRPASEELQRRKVPR